MSLSSSLLHFLASPRITASNAAAGTTIKCPHEPHSGARCHAPDDHHLDAASSALDGIPPASPADHEAGLDVAEDEERNNHSAYGPEQAMVDVVDEHVGDEWDEAADEVAGRDGQGAGDGARGGGFGEGVLEAHEEVEAFGGGGEMAHEFLHRCARDVVRAENCRDIVCDGRWGRGYLVAGFCNGSFVGFSVDANIPLV